MSIPQEGGGPIEDFSQLAGYLSDGCKPADKWRIGAEHEKFGYDLATRAPLPYDGPCSVRAMLEGLRDQFGWSPIMEGDSIIGLTKGGANVSLEPGGQFELSGAPLENLHQIDDETRTHIDEVKQIAGQIGAGYLGLGASPDWGRADIPVMPKGRYNIMRNYMPTVGSKGLDMMFRSCTVQVNLDFGSEADMVQKLRVAIALQPFASALFANSPFIDGASSGFKTFRSEIWRDVDNQRAGMIPFVFDDGFGFDRWVEYALDTPMYFVYRGGTYINATGHSFRDFLKGELAVMPGEMPTLSDWGDHLTTLFPEARIKQFMEMRGADSGLPGMLSALPAFWVGLLYNQTALDAAWDLVKNWTDEQRQQLRDDVPRYALDAKINGVTVGEISKEVLAIADAGLKARNIRHNGQNESCYLDPVHQIVADNQTVAEKMLQEYQSHGDMTQIYSDYSY